MVKLTDASALKIGTAAASAAYMGSTKVFPSGAVTFVQDSLDDTSGVLLSAHVGQVGATWTKNTASGAVNASFNASNRLINNNGGGTSVYTASGVPPSADYVVQADFIELSALAGATRAVAARWQNTTALSGYVFQYSVTSLGWKLFMINAGASTQLGTTAAQTLTIGQTYVGKLQVQGNQISGIVDGVTVVGPISDSTWTAAGFAGLYFNGGGSLSTGMATDNFSATTL